MQLKSFEDEIYKHQDKINRRKEIGEVVEETT